MPSFLPKQLTALVGSDSTLARVNNNVRSAVQPTLEFLQTFFAGGADGTLRLVRNTIAQGSFKAANGFASVGSTALTGDTQLNGNLLIYTRTSNGVVIVPQGGTPAFYVSNPANTAALFLVDSSGNATAASITSGLGIPEALYMGSYYNSSITAGAVKQTMDPLYNDNGGTINTSGCYFKFPRAGSVIGYSVRQEVIPSGSTTTMYYYKNGSQVGQSITVTTAAGTFPGTHSKGTYAFAANDEFTVRFSSSAAGAFAAIPRILIEMAS